MPRDNTTLKAGQYWDVPGQPINGVRSIHVLQLWYQLVFGGTYVEFEYLDEDGKRIHRNVVTTADQFYKDYVKESGLTLRENVKSDDLEGDVTDTTLRGSIASLYKDEPDTLTEGSYKVKMTDAWWLVSGTGIEDDSTRVHVSNSLISILQGLGYKATVAKVIPDRQSGVIRVSRNLVPENALDKALSELDNELKKNGKSYGISDSRSITLRDSIVSLYGPSLDEDVHTLSTEETVEDLVDRAMTMLDDLLNDEADFPPSKQFDMIDRTLNQALDTIESSTDLDIETRSYLKQDIEMKRKEVDYQRRVYSGDDVEESLDLEESPLHVGDYTIKDEGGHVAIYDKDGNFLQSNDTRSEAIYDINHGLVEPKKSSTSDYHDPRGKDIAWDGYDY